MFPSLCLHSCYIYFHCSYLYNYYNYFDPCAFQHFIPICNKISLLLWVPRKEGTGGESRGDRAETEGDSGLKVLPDGLGPRNGGSLVHTVGW